MKRIEQNIRATTDVYSEPSDRADAPEYWRFTVDGKERYVSPIADRCRHAQEVYIENALRATKQATRMLRDFGFLVVPPGRRGKNKK
jgi:hypothetical protein